MGTARLLSFEGRTTRLDFWITAILIAATSLVFIASIFVVFGGPLTGSAIAFRAFLAANMIASPNTTFELLSILVYASAAHSKSAIFPVFALIFGAIGLALIGWLASASVIKRLHDHGRSGSVSAKFLFLLLVLEAIASLGGGTVSFLAGKAALAAITCGLVELGCLRGMHGPNEYGPDPLDAPKTPRRA